ncbi:uncharacterized protein K441DRAFT_673453 [Cenococcum geophilum 1.58]|uniref:uncharacterized protein n=1 Tax=Cenococcum geophilum 1.58 TaxID=794803 RepID=UPI00358F3562|nr:hypothetical protein K441DRAFT_673453 [Cenococcum geophilum 1.58]
MFCDFVEAWAIAGHSCHSELHVFSGALISLPLTAVASMTEDLSSLGDRLSVVFMPMSFSSLIGSPVTGAIVKSLNDTYGDARIRSGTVIIAGAVLMTLTRMLKVH